MVGSRVPYLLGHAEIAALFDVKRQTSQLWRSDGTLAEPDLLASGNPYWLLSTVMALDGQSGRAVSAQRLNAYRESLPAGCEPEERDRLPVILGIKEVAQVLTVDVQAVSRWRNRKAIAEPDLLLSRSPLWLLETIVHDAAQRGRDISLDDVERIRSGARAPQRPRGRRASTSHSPPRPVAEALPAARKFEPAEASEAQKFMSDLLARGLAVVVRPTRTL